MATLFSLALFCSIKEKKVGGIYLEQYISSVFHHVGFFPYEDFAVFKYEAICGTEIYLLLSLVWELLVYIWCAKTLQLCPTLCNPMDCSLLGSCVHGIPQARILEWVTSPFSRGSSQPRDQTQVSYVFCIGRQVLYHLSLIKVNRSLWKWGSWICTFSQISRWFFFSPLRARWGTFLAVQWLGLHVCTAGGLSSISGQETKILNDRRHSQKLLKGVRVLIKK